MSRKAAHVPVYPCLTQLMTRGTFYDVGHNVGLTFREHIRRYFAESDSIQNKLFPFYHSQAGRVYYEESLRVCQDCFPQYVREVRGMADGAGLPFEQVFMVNISKEVYNVLFDEWKKEDRAGNNLDSQKPNYPPADSSDQKPRCQPDSKEEGQRKETLPPGKSDSPRQCDSTQNAQKESSQSPFQKRYGCSDVFLNRPECQFIVHNEDGDPIMKPYGYLVSAEIEEDGVKEQFTSFAKPGFLCGGTWGFNVHGLTISVDSLYPDHVVKRSPSRVFVNRSLLRAKDVADAVGLAQNNPWGVAYGFCANISTKEGRMVSVEVGPAKPQSLVHVYDIPQQSNPKVPCHYYHFNTYKKLLEVSEFDGLICSTLRSWRAEELPAPQTLQQALAILADTEDPRAPIFRTPRPTDDAQTLCTAAFDVIARKVLVYQDRDALLADKPFVKLSMYQ